MKHRHNRELEIPRLPASIKEMNGKSTRRLKECIDQLDNVLGNKNKEGSQEGSDSPDSAPDIE